MNWSTSTPVRGVAADAEELAGGFAALTGDVTAPCRDSSSVMSSTGAMTTMVNSRTRGAVLACVIADPPGRARYEQTSFQSRILIVTQYNRKVTTKLMVFIFKKAQICPAPWA